MTRAAARAAALPGAVPAAAVVLSLLACAPVLHAAVPAQRAVDAQLRAVDGDRDIEVSARVETLDGAVVVDFDGATPRVLASNTKVFTTAAVLLAMDPDARWTTRCLLDGDTLWVIGDGDPSLRDTALGDHAAAFLDALAEALLAAGGSTLRSVVLDARAFPGPPRPPGWPENQWQREYCAPVSALQVGGSCLTVELAGSRPRVWPPLGGRLQVDFREGPFDYKWKEEDAALLVFGKTETSAPGRLAVRDPLWLYGAWLEEGLERRGVDVAELRRAEGEEPVPEVEPLLEHASAWTLAEAVAVVNKDSDNQLAETLLCTLGRFVEGEGTREAGLRALSATLTEAGLEVEGMDLVDGSGMSRGPADEDNNRASPAQLCAVLRRIAEEPQGRVLFLSLPIGGEDGRLQDRFRDDVFRDGRVRAKTGFIYGASSLSGYMVAADRTILVFSIVVNYKRDGTARTNNARFKQMQEDFLADVLRASPWR